MVEETQGLMSLLEEVCDPEIPVLNIVELGILRHAEQTNDVVKVVITPTYSGCPAMSMIENEIRACLGRHGFHKVSIEITHSPPWTSDWITDEAKEKLRQYGIAPPGHVKFEPLIGLPRSTKKEPCPFCGSTDTELRSEFGSTSCKSFHFCKSCSQPFEHFKAF